MSDWQWLNDIMPGIITLSLLLLSWVAFFFRPADPISKFARANFKMKYDQKTGLFWAKPRKGIQPPCICSECEFVGCTTGRSKPGHVLVDCPAFKRLLPAPSQNGVFCEESRGERP